MTLLDQIHKIEKRLEEKPDPLLAEVLKSLKKLEELHDVEGLRKFHEREYCSIDEAAEYLGCSRDAVQKNVKNYFKPKGRPHRIDIPAIAVGKEGKPTYIIVKRGLKHLKKKYQS